ncbi:hypothetical protein [Enterococcus sp. AZ180]|uniref:hypothetical protein n=1 Tax=Enterococcus sp. AZ180 TaxID=2774961 RepID=UPI003F28880F
MEIRNLILLILTCIALVFTIAYLLLGKIKNSKANAEKLVEEKSQSSFIDADSKSKLVKILSKDYSRDPAELEKIFKAAGNPWGVSTATFRLVRLGSLVGGVIVSLFLVLFIPKYAFVGIMFGLIGWFYPLYFYKETARERAAEWNRIYEYIWVIKHSCLLYDAKKVFLETRDYIQENNPEKKELINGFNDFYENWDPAKIPDMINEKYPFPIPNEIYNIIFNMNLTGESPDQQLDSLKDYSINKSDGVILEVLSGVEGKATLFSLPFLMLSIILALIVPLFTNIMKLM